MANEQSTKPPPFETMVAASSFMSAAEIDKLIEEHAALVAEAKLGAGVRWSLVAWILGNRWS